MVKKEIAKLERKEYDNLIASVGALLEKAREKVYFQVNQILVKTYWEIGKRIVEYEQKGEEKADYGSKLFDNLAKDLRKRYGRGFSRSNVIYMRLLYLKYPKSQTLSDQLTWSHYVEILMIEACASLYRLHINKHQNVRNEIEANKEIFGKNTEFVWQNFQELENQIRPGQIYGGKIDGEELKRAEEIFYKVESICEPILRKSQKGEIRNTGNKNAD